MKMKRILDPRRLRKAPPQGFGWIDHRLLRERYFEWLSPNGLALYALLVCAADHQGLSYYSDARVCDLLGIDSLELSGARRELLQQRLIAFENPLYQVLALDGFEPQARGARRPMCPSPNLSAPAAAAPETGRKSEASTPAPRLSLREMLRAKIEGAAV
jgi:hypothetical protein